LEKKGNLATVVNKCFNRQSKSFSITLGFILVFIVGVADYLSGTELSISIFYLVPISLMSWFVSRRAGILLSIGSSGIELMTDLIVGHTYSHPIIVYWNNAVQLGFFIIIVFILSALKNEYEKTMRLNVDLHGTLVELERTQGELERKAQDLARSNVELEQFAYVAAHDLKGPLITAGGYIRRLRRLYKDKLDPDADRYIGYIIDGMIRMEALINDLLAYAKVGTKVKELNWINCNEIIELAIANLQAEIEKKGAVVTHDLLPTLWADDIQMVQLLQNLISNGIKFHKEEPPRVHISSEQREKEWIFSFSDNGIGIDSKDINRIFDIFQRLHSDPEYLGNGIGLAVCKKIVERHGGKIWVKSWPQKGSTFYIALPIKEKVE
jgi:signal transduction histidine kinase